MLLLVVIEVTLVSERSMVASFVGSTLSYYRLSRGHTGGEKRWGKSVVIFCSKTARTREVINF